MRAEKTAKDVVATAMKVARNRPGLYSPIGLFRANICWPNGVNGGVRLSALPLPPPLPAKPPGTLAPDDGPAHVPVRSRFGAGPPSPTALSAG